MRRGVIGPLILLLGAACRQSAPHPLDPLSASEIRATQSVLTARGLLAGSTRIMLLDLQEPPKADVLAKRDTPREAFVVIYDATRNTTSEVVVDIGAGIVRSSRIVPGAEPALDGVDAAITET